MGRGANSSNKMDIEGWGPRDMSEFQKKSLTDWEALASKDMKCADLSFRITAFSVSSGEVMIQASIASSGRAFRSRGDENVFF